MRLAVGFASSAAIAVVGVIVVVLFGLVGRQYSAPCTTDACTYPGADVLLLGGAILVVLGVLSFALLARSGLRGQRKAK